MISGSMPHVASALLVWMLIAPFVPGHTSASEARTGEGAVSPLESVREQRGVVALGGAIVRRSGVELVTVTGKRKKGSQEEVQPGDSFHIGSCAKAMTATVIAILVEEQKLRWDQTIGETFPELAGEIHPGFLPVTLEQLLLHRGGIAGDIPPGLWRELRAAADKMPPAEQRLRLLRGMLAGEPVASPGSESIYSNAGYAIAGVMAERATGKSWETLMKEKLFDPLGMESAGFGPPGSPDSVIQPWGHRGVLFGTVAFFNDNPPAIAPAGTVHCSLEDWAKFIGIHLRREDVPQLRLSAKSIRKLQTPPDGGNEAFGWMVFDRDWGGRVLMFAGSNTNWYAVAWLAPEKGFSLLAVTNQGDPAGFPACDDAVGVLLKEAMRQPSANPSSHLAP